jgi:signal transduction histidine kinase
MRAIRSLRASLFLGAVLWTAGLFAAAVIISTAILLRSPRYPRILHGTAATHGTWMAIFALACMGGGLALVRSGLTPINRLRARLSAVHEGRETRVEGTYPAEVQPLVNDLNALLNDREKRVARALAKAGDLAHGLKTPLAVLSQEGEHAETDGHGELAAVINQQVARMRRQIDYHLAHARAAASGSSPRARSSVRESAEALSRTLDRLHAGRGLAIDLRVGPEHAVRARREDLDEMLGNLLDNACKWARSRVTLASSASDSSVILTVDDDGPGVAPSMRDAVLQRGMRADEAAPGSGLGLAIVRDLAELHQGSIALDRSPMGGLRATLTLPAALPAESNSCN